jgi:hypothetical protein
MTKRRSVDQPVTHYHISIGLQMPAHNAEMDYGLTRILKAAILATLAAISAKQAQSIAHNQTVYNACLHW